MAAIGFIGASGSMGHGMANNLLAKGHALSLTVHRNREHVADLLGAGAVDNARKAVRCDSHFAEGLAIPTWSPPLPRGGSGWEGSSAVRRHA